MTQKKERPLNSKFQRIIFTLNFLGWLGIFSNHSNLNADPLKSFSSSQDVAAQTSISFLDKSPFPQQKRATTAEPPAQISIASFNIRIFSNKSRSEQELSLIAKLLRKYDVIAIQELRDEKVLKRTITILKNLGYSYQYDLSDPVGTKTAHELYAFLYRSDKVQLIQKGLIYKNAPEKFIRPPFYANFKAGNFDFTLMTIHILFGKNKSLRRPEILALANAYQTIQQKDGKENDLILLGDFNMSPDDAGFQQLKSIPTMHCLILPPEKTTITDTSLYDNFWFQRQYVKEYTGLSGINRFDETMFGNDDEKAKLAISDHRLVWSVYNIATDDDD